MTEYDAVQRPAHYNAYPDVEVIDLTKHMNFCLGNVVKYVARADYKGKPMEDLAKARTYLDIEIARRERVAQLEQEDAGQVPPEALEEVADALLEDSEKDCLLDVTGACWRAEHAALQTCRSQRVR